ncbi:MAG: hypothetical protein AAGE94_19520, partial [Acidobacteriota bacterium]
MVRPLLGPRAASSRVARSRVALCCVAVALALVCVGLIACAPTSSSDGSGPAEPIALVQRWADVQIERPTPPPEQPPASEIRFDGEGLAAVEWAVVDGVADARVENGRLVGRSTSTAPVIRLDLP